MNAQQILFIIWFIGMIGFILIIYHNILSLLTLSTFMFIRLKLYKFHDMLIYIGVFFWPIFLGYLIYLRIRYIYDYPNQPVTLDIKKIGNKSYIAIRKRRKNSCEGCVGDAHGRLFSNELCKKLGKGKCDYHIWEEI